MRFKRMTVAVAASIALVLAGVLPASAADEAESGSTSNVVGDPEYNVLGETPTQPDARARMSVATPTRITFSENPVGTYVQSLYVATHGVQFGPTAFVATDGANPRVDDRDVRRWC